MQHELAKIQAAFELRNGRVFRLRDGREITPVTGPGYQVVGALGLTFRLHRVIFALHHGFLPVIVDHIDQNPRNNLISNLRAATPRENGANAKRRFDSRSGTTGVVWHCRKRAWQVRIGVARKMIYLGSFQSFDEALAVRTAANQRYNFSKRHGSGRITFKHVAFRRAPEGYYKSLLRKLAQEIDREGLA